MDPVRALAEQARQCVELLLRGRAVALELDADEQATADLYTAACRVIMRMVVTRLAEARGLLSATRPDPGGLDGLLEELERSSPEARARLHDAWPRVLEWSRAPRACARALAQPPDDGDLFCRGDARGDVRGDGAQRALARLESPIAAPDDELVYRLLTLLFRVARRVREGAGWRTITAPVDLRAWPSEAVGVVYEHLAYEIWVRQQVVVPWPDVEVGDVAVGAGQAAHEAERVLAQLPQTQHRQ
ncbi:MAG: hypothetical protein KC468_24865, partial [Myxococcales bacterium]|nr:hypothetical protein [Myxococcales bacterium]